LNTSINHILVTLDANIDDLKVVIDNKRPEEKLYRSSVCDLWLRLKTVEQMEFFSLVTFLRTNQFHRSNIKLSEINNDTTTIGQQRLTNPRRSRLIHFHICAGSDQFNSNIGSYVGLLIFSYDNQSKFKLNGRHSQRGDIMIKQTKFFNHPHTTRRGIYDALFKWYFDCLLSERFFGTGFLCVNGKWRFDLITYDERELYSYEYRLLDMFMLTHWLTTLNLAHNVQEMEMNAKDLLENQFDLVKKIFVDQEKRTDLVKNWNEKIGTDSNDLQLAIEQFNEGIEKEIKTIFRQIDIKKNVSVGLLTQTT
jgi:hypothetical protein